MSYRMHFDLTASSVAQTKASHELTWGKTCFSNASLLSVKPICDHRTRSIFCNISSVKILHHPPQRCFQGLSTQQVHINIIFTVLCAALRGVLLNRFLVYYALCSGQDRNTQQVHITVFFLLYYVLRSGQEYSIGSYHYVIFSVQYAALRAGVLNIFILLCYFLCTMCCSKGRSTQQAYISMLFLVQCVLLSGQEY